MQEVFIKAIERLTDPMAIVLIVSMFANALLILTVVRILPKIHLILGKHTAILEFMLYGENKKNR